MGSYSVGGTYSTITISREYSTVDELLQGLYDNNAGAIQAGNVRDGVYSLWKKVEGLSASVGLSGTTSVFYSSATPSSIRASIGGINPGSTFSGTIQNILDTMFYPYVDPVPIISQIGLGYLEFGSPTSIVLNYSVSVGTNPITPGTLLVAGISKSFPPYTGTQPVSATHSTTPLTASESNTFVISVNDGVNTITGTQTLYWYNKRYWGKVNLTSIGNPNLSLNPGSSSLVASICTDGLILGLNGAGANGVAYGEEFAVVKDKVYNNIDGQGEYLVFAWPSTFPGATAPSFKVNGMVNTAFTNVRTSSPMVNSQGFSGVDYEVWVSNTKYHSPVNIEIS